VHLGDGSGGQGFAIDGGEHVFGRSTQLFLDYLVNNGPRLGSDLISTSLEFGDQLGRENTFAGRDDLAELDIGRSEVLRGHPQPA
jgi:hypothetical protein